jgi:hypothetical protein
VLLGLQDMKRDLDEKTHKRHWGAIKVPFTLHEGLGTYTKSELDDIRKKLDLKNVSSLKKAELIEVLQSSLRERENLENICLLWDSERFDLLVKIAGNGGQLNAPHLEPTQIRYLRDSGLIYSGTFDGKSILAVPSELVEPIVALKNHLQLRAKINRNTEWIKLTAGLLYYYGTLSTTVMTDMTQKHTKDKIDFREYLAVIHDSNDYQKAIYINENGFSNLRVFDPKRVKQEQEMRKNVPYYPFTKQQLLTAGEPEFVDRNKSYRRTLVP